MEKKLQIEFWIIDIQPIDATSNNFFSHEPLKAKIQIITFWTVNLDMDSRGPWWAQGPNFWAHGHPPRGTLETGTQIILLQIDGFLYRLDLKKCINL